jgi:hypothetical protein
VEAPQPLNYQSQADFKKETGGLFGPDQVQIWSQFADQFGARLDDTVPRKPRVSIPERGWKLTLDVEQIGEYSFTRMRAAYVNPQRFRFMLWREGFFSKIGKLLGMEDIQVGHDDFDSEFVVRSNQPEQIRRLLSNAPLRRLLHLQPPFEMMVRDGQCYAGNDYAKPIDELQYRMRGVARDLVTLHNLHDLFTTTLELLRQMGATYETSEPT